MRIGEYSVLKMIGEGGFGIVYLVEKNGRQYALKQSTKSYPHVLERFFKEATKVDDIRRKYNLEYLAEIVEILINEKAYVMEYMEEGSMEYYRRTHDNNFLLNLIYGVNELHKIGIAHRDLKPENVRVRGNTPVILDFGAASWAGSLSGVEYIGTPCFMPPETFYVNPEYTNFPLIRKAGAQIARIKGMDEKDRIKKIKKLQDVFSLALTVGSIATGEYPYRNCKDVSLFLQNGSKVLKGWINRIEDKNIREFVREASAFFPLDRPLLPQLLDKYFQSKHFKLTQLPTDVKEISQESPYVCIECGKITDPPAKYCAYCGADLRYLAFHIMPRQEIEIRSVPPCIRYVDRANVNQNFLHQTLLIDINGEDFEISIGRERGNIIFRNDSWMSRAHGKIIKRGPELFYVDGVDGRMPKNISQYNGIVVGEKSVPLDSGGALTVGSTLIAIEKYFGELF